MFILFPNLPAGDCLLEVQLVYAVSKPTCRGLSAGGAACLYGFQTYLQGTVCRMCSLFTRFPNLPAGDCRLEVQLVYTVSKPTFRGLSSVGAVSKPTCRGLSVGGAACLYGFQTYLQGNVCCRCSLFIRFSNLPAGTVFWRCSFFIRFPNLPA